jgi:hypothetical protein
MDHFTVVLFHSPGADGKELPGVANKTTPYDIAMSISKGLAEASVVAKVFRPATM